MVVVGGWLVSGCLVDGWLVVVGWWLVGWAAFNLIPFSDDR